MNDNNKPSGSLIPHQNNSLVYASKIIKITDKLINDKILVPFLLKNGKYIFVDFKTNTPVYSCIEFDFADVFYEGMSRIILNGKFGFVNEFGEIVIQPIYDRAENFSCSLALVYSEDRVNWDYKHCFINNKGEEVISLKSYHEARGFSEGYALVGKNEKYGFIDTNGLITVPLKYDTAWDFSEGLCGISLDQKFGFVNKKGAVVVPTIYNESRSFSDGLAPVQQIDKWDYYMEGIDGKWGFINEKNEIILPFEFSYSSMFRNGVAMVNFNGKDGIINRNGKEFIEIHHKWGPFYGFNDGLAIVNDGDNTKSGFINTSGDVVIPLIYQTTFPFSNGFAMVSYFSDGMYFFIDKTGREFREK